MHLAELTERSKRIAVQILHKHGEAPLKVYGHPRGGISAMFSVLRYLPNATPVTYPQDADIIIEDIYDTGKTYKKLSVYKKPVYFIIDKREENIPEWIVFPWEDEFKEYVSMGRGELC